MLRKRYRVPPTGPSKEHLPGAARSATLGAVALIHADNRAPVRLAQAVSSGPDASDERVVAAEP